MRALLLAAALILGVAGCGGASGTEPPAGTAATDPAAAPAGSGDPLAGRTLDGEQLSLGDFRGRYLFVNVWSSW
jgi:hypothetical protein